MLLFSVSSFLQPRFTLFLSSAPPTRHPTDREKTAFMRLYLAPIWLKTFFLFALPHRHTRHAWINAPIHTKPFWMACRHAYITPTNNFLSIFSSLLFFFSTLFTFLSLYQFFLGVIYSICLYVHTFVKNVCLYVSLCIICVRVHNVQNCYIIEKRKNCQRATK